ncbi:MAG: sensor histidine kinase [Candidatus Odinarchaeota archaeon]
MISELSFSNLRLNYLLKEQENIESLLRNQKIMLINALDRSDFYKDLLIHDIANVLHNIQLSIDLLEMKEDKQLKRQNLQEIINIVINNVKKGISLVSRVRQLIKVNEKKTNKRVGLKKLINNSICNIKAQFENENKKILTELPEEVIKIKGGSLLLEAFENIMKNAIIHNDSEVKKIWIRVSKTYYKDNNWVKLEFMDNGKGIDYDRRKTIFERSIKQDKSELGMGIGLSLVKRIINGYGGIIEVQDRIKGIYQEGSNFIVLLRSK